MTVVEEGSERAAGRIGPGLLALTGFAADDPDAALDWTAAKLADLRLFPGEGGEFDRSLAETDGGLLLVSQFTLYGDATKGRRPDFGAAAPYAEARSLWERLVARCEERLPGRVEAGEFGARMRVALVNDGPVTLWLER